MITIIDKINAIHYCTVCIETSISYKFGNIPIPNLSTHQDFSSIVFSIHSYYSDISESNVNVFLKDFQYCLELFVGKQKDCIQPLKNLRFHLDHLTPASARTKIQKKYVSDKLIEIIKKTVDETYNVQIITKFF